MSTQRYEFHTFIDSADVRAIGIPELRGLRTNYRKSDELGIWEGQSTIGLWDYCSPRGQVTLEAAYQQFLHDDHKAALAEKEAELTLANGMMNQATTHAEEVMGKLHEREAELEKARELLKATLEMMKHMNASPAHAASWAEPNDNALTLGIADITAYLGDRA